jgi:YjbE family integral membrane protein
MNSALQDVLLQLLAIVWINVVLSGDNAVVIALACRALPDGQRRRAILFGSLAAVLMRVVFTLVVVELLALPFLKLVCGVLLLFIAVRLVAKGDTDHDVTAAPSIWAAVRTIAFADAIMSLDNVVAIAAAAKGSWLLIVFGLALSVPLIVFGSTLMLKLMARLPLLAWVGAALLSYVAGQLSSADPWLAAWLGPRMPDYVLPVSAAIFVVVAAALWRYAMSRRARAPGLDEVGL